MRFSILTTILAAACAIAAPAPEKRDVSASVTVDAAVNLVNGLTATLQVHVNTINSILPVFKTAKTQADKDAATAKINAEFSAMTVEVAKTIGDIGAKANGVSVSARALPTVIGDLVKAIQDLVTLVTSVVKAVLAVVNLSAVLQTVTALLGSITGLIQTLLSTVNGLVAALKPVLAGILASLNGILKIILG